MDFARKFPAWLVERAGARAATVRSASRLSGGAIQEKSRPRCRARGRGAPGLQRLTHSEVKNVVPNACRRAGLAKRLTTHGLRHSFASHLVMRGVTLVAVQKLLGHQQISTTMRYAHLAPSTTREAVRLLDSRVEPAWNQKDFATENATN